MQDNKIIKIKDVQVGTRTNQNDDDYISLTDMAKWKNSEDPRFVVQKWLFTKYTITFLGHLDSDENLL